MLSLAAPTREDWADEALASLDGLTLERTDFATKTLHHFKLARYLHLPEPAAQMLRAITSGRVWPVMYAGT